MKRNSLLKKTLLITALLGNLNHAYAFSANSVLEHAYAMGSDRSTLVANTETTVWRLEQIAKESAIKPRSAKEAKFRNRLVQKRIGKLESSYRIQMEFAKNFPLPDAFNQFSAQVDAGLKQLKTLSQVKWNDPVAPQNYSRISSLASAWAKNGNKFLNSLK